ncbi:hypothetical protein ACFRJ3_45300 [Streptomyces sp. NPDC056696]|uniref:hypothetical protein n=1 Tax=unclassified Streptomyces TaxID=2593676 RepID=UPI00368E92A9
MGAGHFARSTERLAAYTKALWMVVHPDVHRRWRSVEPLYDPVRREVDFTAQQAAEAAEQQMHRDCAAAAERVHHAFRSRRTV